MNFVYPYLLILMLIPFVIFTLLVLTNKDNASRVFNADVLRRLRVDGDVLPSKVRNTILLLSALMMIIALGRPIIKHGERSVPLRGLDAMVALDISGSMRTKDIYPSRMVSAKLKIAQLLEYMPGDEISLAAFAHASFMLAPFTTDIAALGQILDGVDESYINLASTDFGVLANLAATFLEKKKPKILVVFTDGGDAQALKSFESTLKDANITLYAVLVGTKKGAPVIDSNGHPVKTQKGTIAITQRNDSLGKIAESTGGSFFIARNGKSDMEELANNIHTKFSTKKRGNIKIKEQTELFVYFLGIATLLLFLGLISIPKNPLRHRHKEKK